MDLDVIRDKYMSYLWAIQKVPGDTASEKMKWIGKTADCSFECPELIKHPSLQSLMKVEIAVRQKQVNELTTALKSEDAMVVNRALKAKWYFNNSCVDIPAEYLSKNLFPHLSVNTRARVVKKLADCITDPLEAEIMLDELLNDYCIYNVCPLIAVCEEDFTLNIIEEWKLALPVNTAKKIFRKNPDLLIHYFKLLKPATLEERSPFPVNMMQYRSFLPKLVKTRVHDFAELVEMYETFPLPISLSNTCAEIFLKKGLQYLLKKPHLYINILPLKKINVDILESIFIDLLPEKISDCDMNKVIQYLKYYPESKKYELLHKSYLKKYNFKLLNYTKNINAALLQILPEKERIKQARIKIESEAKSMNHSNAMNCENTWICYLSIDEAIPALRKKINTENSSHKRVNIIREMIYACKINEKRKDNDESTNKKDAAVNEKDAAAEEKDALADTLKYFLDRHRNEEIMVYEGTMRQLLNSYDVPHLSKERHKVLFDIIKLFYVKFEHVTENITQAVIHFRLINNMPIDDLISMLIKTAENDHYVNFNLLIKYPQYERKCLDSFAKHFEEKYFDLLEKQNKENELKTLILYNFVDSMYNFNDRCDRKRTKIERLSIKDYPRLLSIIRGLISQTTSVEQGGCPFTRRKCQLNQVNVKNLLKIKEPQLEIESDSESSKIADVSTVTALALLKRNPQEILDNWEAYLTQCKSNYRNKITQRFVRATRWYKDIPIKFAERCMEELKEKCKDTKKNILPTLTILALLFYGNTLTKMLMPLIPKESKVDANHPEVNENYRLACHIPKLMILSNPPVSTELICNMCEGDYLSVTLGALTNASRRYNSSKAVALANKLSTMRVSVQKHGIRLMSQVVPEKSLISFLKEMWTNKTNCSIREVVFEEIQKIMHLMPVKDIKNLNNMMMDKIQLKDKKLLWLLKLPLRLPNYYILDYYNKRLQTIERLQVEGLNIEEAKEHVTILIREMSMSSVFNFINECLVGQIIKKYLFDVDVNLSKATRNFSLLYIFSGDSRNNIKERCKVLIESIDPIMKTQWNKTDSEYPYFFPHNNAVHLLIEDFVVKYVTEFYFATASTDMQLLDIMLELFSTILDPTQAPTPYLMLIYAKKLQEGRATNQPFACMINQYMPELIKIFSSSLVQFMGNSLNRFLDLTFKNKEEMEESKFDIIEYLIISDNRDSWLMAVTLFVVMALPNSLENREKRFIELIKMFRERKDPAVSSILHNYLNCLSINCSLNKCSELITTSSNYEASSLSSFDN
ncbi:uncharacterized protein LOC114936276 [Nylanderia fulva]|uniref:uncharacterized protein LOC114936276 n=1 Tax=Nylanderia fulva TaxID=613905 RepID=UPI0010FB863F|nr:uncharacterized protein LOC114936276 [Nylanderia fulva]